MSNSCHSSCFKFCSEYLETARQIPNLRHLIFQEMKKNLGLYSLLLCKHTYCSHGQGTEKDFLLTDTGVHRLWESTRQTRNPIQVMLNIHFLKCSILNAKWHAPVPLDFLRDSASCWCADESKIQPWCEEEQKILNAVLRWSAIYFKIKQHFQDLLGSYASVYTTSCA